MTYSKPVQNKAILSHSCAYCINLSLSSKAIYFIEIYANAGKDRF